MTQEKEQSSRDKKIMKMVDEDNFLTKESELNFNCNACGKCCFNQDIILTTLEILRLRREFEVPTSGILDMFCQVHRGPNSQLPVMLLKFKPLDSGVTACPFLKANEGNQKASCSIHQNSPEVCKLYPLGRGFIHDIKTKKHEVKYFCMDKADLACDKDCFSCKNTVGDYLNKNSVVDSGKYQEQYNKLITQFADIAIKEKGHFEEDFTLLKLALCDFDFFIILQKFGELKEENKVKILEQLARNEEEKNIIKGLIIEVKKYSRMDEALCMKTANKTATDEELFSFYGSLLGVYNEILDNLKNKYAKRNST